MHMYYFNTIQKKCTDLKDEQAKLEVSLAEVRESAKEARAQSEAASGKAALPKKAPMKIGKTGKR